MTYSPGTVFTLNRGDCVYTSPMKTVYMNEDGEIAVTLTKYVNYADGVGFEVTKENYITDQEEEEINKEKVDRIVKEIERAAKVEGLKKFAVDCRGWSHKSISEMNELEVMTHERQKDYITKAMELAEVRGYKFTGDITLSDKPVDHCGEYSPEKSLGFKRYYFIEPMP